MPSIGRGIELSVPVEITIRCGAMTQANVTTDRTQPPVDQALSQTAVTLLPFPRPLVSLVNQVKCLQRFA
jgi:hypothetical protein